MIYFICHVHLDTNRGGQDRTRGNDGVDIRTSDEKAVRDNRRDDNLRRIAIRSALKGTTHLDWSFGGAEVAVLNGLCQLRGGVIMVLCTID